MAKYTIALRWADGHTTWTETDNFPGRRWIVPRQANRPVSVADDFSMFGAGYDVFHDEQDTFRRVGMDEDGVVTYQQETD
jgi:hypothetical protein